MVLVLFLQYPPDTSFEMRSFQTVAGTLLLQRVRQPLVWFGGVNNLVMVHILPLESFEVPSPPGYVLSGYRFLTTPL